MLTYLSLHLNKWKKRPVLFLLLFLFPLLSTCILYPLLERTAEETAVPVAIADEDDSSYSRIILERLQEAERLRFTAMTKEEAEKAVRKGTMEAAFILESGLEDTIRLGQVDNVVTWIRADESLLDVFAKEAVGAQVMRLALNAKAGVDVSAANGTASFEEAFAYSEEFWEPEPLFQVHFTERSPENPSMEAPKLEGWQVMVIQLYFLYSWMLALFFLRTILADDREGRLDRIRLLQGTTTRYFFHHFLLFGLVGIGSFALSICGLFYFAATPQELIEEWVIRSILVFAVTLFITWCLFMGTGRKRWSIPVLLLLALASFMLTVSGIGYLDMWPHYWLVKKW
ncbi:ABC transporter permease [Halobacillus sp. ACCC02827]|uniref:ABC transporter permease n=1 Tax=Halobacillus sp. ACCC02827 TaxID=3052090 RepID=UPI002570F750|nr:ABC transporter permease [Halobacillus sp. ACCC02827]WJE15048.1 ABC transporter permease [Halobacillus sp. ACCC02827]